MKDMNGPIIVGYWLVGALLIGSAFAYFTFGKASGQTKRKMFRWYMVIGGLFVSGWFALLGGILAFVAGLALMAVFAPINWYLTRFCDACGATMFNQFVHSKFCPRCGANLDAQDRERADCSKCDP